MPPAPDAALDLTPQPATAELVLRLATDEAADPMALVSVIETDPALAARVLRLANSVAYGVSGRVGSVRHATVLLGAPTVRGLSLSAALAVLDEQHDPGPSGTWVHSLATAAGTAVAARETGWNEAEAFTAGLLHDVGATLLHRRDPEAFAATQALAETGRISEVLLAELRAFGTTHAQAGADALTAWGLPNAVVEAVAAHHGADEPRHKLGRLLRAGQVLALAVVPTRGHPPEHDLDEVLPAAGIARVRGDALVAATRTELDRLVAVLGGGR